MHSAHQQYLKIIYNRCTVHSAHQQYLKAARHACMCGVLSSYIYVLQESREVFDNNEILLHRRGAACRLLLVLKTD